MGVAVAQVGVVEWCVSIMLHAVDQNFFRWLNVSPVKVSPGFIFIIMTTR